MSYENPYEPPPLDFETSVFVRESSGDGFRIEIRRPEILTFGWIVLTNLLVIPLSFLIGVFIVGAPIGAIAAVGAALHYRQPLFILLAVFALILFVGVVALFYYLPTFSGPNLLSWRIGKRVRERFPERIPLEQYLVQITLTPRYSRGLRAALDDCDDIGMLYIVDDTLLFEGDCCSLILPRRCVDGLDDKGSSAIYGLFGLDKRMAFRLRPSANHPYTSIRISERRSANLLQYYRFARHLFNRLRQWSHTMPA